MARKILLADDSVTAQNMGRKILADAGYEVITVNNGSAALKKVGEHKPDLIVLDVYMPGYSGLEVCQRLKEAGETSRIPVLLTVGKLEPFKPEEARRVRADAFIVKPFEASELLSALSKLEDKVVPRSEPSKPGRFARATAAIDEGRFDRSMVEEDSSWKSRIVFPKKKEKEQEADVDDPAVYNPVNKDLRTVVEHKPAEYKAEQHSQGTQAQADAERVNLSALAPEGLPKDVTPEEIAALAAAAAQVKGASEEKKPEDRPAETTPEAAATAAAEVPAPPIESKQEAAAIEVPPPSLAAPTPEAAEKPPAEVPSKEAEPLPSPADVTQAIADLEQQTLSASKELPKDSWSDAAEIPATMAVAAAVGANGPRWAAVSVALSAEEASISLDQEMQQAAASFAAAPKPSSSEISAIVSEAVPATLSMSETVQESSTPYVAPSTAIAPAEEAPMMQDAPPSSYEPSIPANPVISTVPQDPVPVPASDHIEQKLGEAAATIEQAVPPASPETSELTVKPEEATDSEVSKQSTPSVEMNLTEQSTSAAPAQLPTSEIRGTEIAPEIKVPAHEPVEPVIPVVNSETTSKETIAEEDTSSSVPTTTIGGRDEMAKKESEMTATTAAAWASWRKIRETGDNKPTNEDAPEPKDEAAKAVAVGAESNPEEVSALDSDPEIASIVDSVLADMRPKIVEEIAKKLGKKK